MKRQLSILIEKFILSAIVIITAFTIIFPLNEISNDTISFIYRGINYLDIRYLRYYQLELMFEQIFYMLCSIIQLIMSAVSIKMFVTLIKKGKNNSKGIIKIAFFVSVLYIIEGIVLQENLKIEYIYKNVSDNFTIKSLYFIPFILQVVFSIVYFVLSNDLLIKSVSISNFSNKSKSYNIEKGAQILKQYKELLDMGVITQEEFEKKKKEIL